MTAVTSEDLLVASLSAGDEAVFADLVERWSGTMLHVARGFVASHETAQDVVQETWLGVIRGIDRFEGRSTLKTWVFRILVNTAKTRGVRDSRTIPFTALAGDGDEGPTVDPSRFRGPDDKWPGGWTEEGRPEAWHPSAESLVVDGELREHIEAAIATLPDRQRIVIMMRDVQGFSSEEVCELLSLTPENQRVLLHRGRAKVRGALEVYFRQAVTA